MAYTRKALHASPQEARLMPGKRERGGDNVFTSRTPLVSSAKEEVQLSGGLMELAAAWPTVALSAGRIGRRNKLESEPPTSGERESAGVGA